MTRERARDILEASSRFEFIDDRVVVRDLHLLALLEQGDNDGRHHEPDPQRLPAAAA